MKPAADAEGASSSNIGHASVRSGVSAKMIRHYETLGLLGEIARSDSGYRKYNAHDIHCLRFIKRARELGFSMNEIGELLSLWHDRGRASAQVRRIAERHANDLAQRVQMLQSMQRALEHLIDCCAGDGRPDCPILDDLAGVSDARAGSR